MADNSVFNIVGPLGWLKPALEIAFMNAPGGAAWGYKYEIAGLGNDSKIDRLILSWTSGDDEDFVPFPIGMDVELTHNVVKRWLENNAIYPQSAWANDGDIEKEYGFRLYCEDWGRIDHKYYAFAAIEPVWALYGK